MNGEKIKYSDFVQNASLFFALVTAFWIPSYRWVLSYFIVGWLIFAFSEFNFRQRFQQNLTNRFEISVFILQISFFLLILSEVFFSDSKMLIFKNIGQKMSLLIFPLLFALSGYNFKTKKYLFLKLFVVSNIIMSLVCLGVALYNSLSFFDGKIIFEPHYLKYRNYFTQSDLSVFHHRGYFSMYIVFSIAVLFFLKEKTDFFTSVIKKILFPVILTFFSVMVFLLNSRAGILSLLILLSWQIILKAYISKNILYKIFMAGFIIFMLFFVLKNDRIQLTVKKIVASEKNETELAGKNSLARPVLWAAAVDIIKENFFTGIGFENFYDGYMKKYKEYHNKKISASGDFRYNVHNQFLEDFVLYGVFGFLLLLSLFIYPLIISFKRKNYLFSAFLLITGFNFLFESMLNTIAGVVFLSFFYNYFIFVFNDKQIKDY